MVTKEFALPRAFNAVGGCTATAKRCSPTNQEKNMELGSFSISLAVKDLEGFEIVLPEVRV